MNVDPNKDNADNYRIGNSKTVTIKSFEYEAKKGARQIIITH